MIRIDMPIGLLGSLIPALALTTASATKSTALSWPTTRSCSISARFSNFSLSVSTNLETGIRLQELQEELSNEKEKQNAIQSRVEEEKGKIAKLQEKRTELDESRKALEDAENNYLHFAHIGMQLPFLVILFQVLVFYHVVILLLFLSYSCSQHLLMLFYFHLIRIR